MPKTPVHSCRIDGDLWRAAAELAAERGETVSDVIRRALAQYVKETPQ